MDNKLIVSKEFGLSDGVTLEDCERDIELANQLEEVAHYVKGKRLQYIKENWWYKDIAGYSTTSQKPGNLDLGSEAAIIHVTTTAFLWLSSGLRTRGRLLKSLAPIPADQHQRNTNERRSAQCISSPYGGEGTRPLCACYFCCC